MLSVYIKGLLIGIANIMPGVSGSTLALALGIYYKIIHSCSNIIKLRDSKNITFLIPLFLGILTSIIICSKALKIYLLDGGIKEACLTMFFVGSITRILFIIKKEIKIKEITNKDNNNMKYYLFLIGFFSTIFLLIIRSHNLSFDISKYQDKNSIEYCLLIIGSGLISGSAMIIPGISGSILLIILGTYKEIINIVSTLNIKLCILFSISTIIGSGITILIIKKTIDKHLIKFLYLSSGLILGSISQMLFIIINLNFNPSLIFFIILIILFTLGLQTIKIIEIRLKTSS
ncbi:DUF368 domain-containing protein [Borrelia sp. A-FGy1]|uniref:undecaprenyl phosphate translocase family protein n=1 Tax=Borrelia sp. A-FGy1 TaxID=2608247 RepID=UPI0015F77AD2|nr:DUF368 domain-containing protein [Borrelia sp. A-FGy1]QMU99505.1 DUF368 domain-containing protein [Borrelia sp. A-FGy1]